MTKSYYNNEDVVSVTKEYVFFCDNYFGMQLRPYQISVARNIMASILNKNGEVFTLVQSRQSGKTEGIILLTIFLAVRFPGIKIGIYAPSFKQATDIIMRRLKGYLRHDVFQGTFQISRGNMVLFKKEPVESMFNNNEGSLIAANSADIASKIEGATWDLMFIDEAQDIERRVLDVSLEPMLTATAGTMVLTGTPFSIDCAFYDTIQAIKNKKINGKNFVIDYKTVIKYFPLYEKTVEKAIARNGESSLSFLTQYAVQWVGGIGLFFNFDEFILRGNESIGWMNEPIPGLTYLCGLDIAGNSDNTQDNDETVLTISSVQDGVITLSNIYRWKNVRWNRMQEEILDLLARWKPVAIAIDSTGIGQNTAQYIKESSVVPHVFFVNFTPITKSAVGYNMESQWKLGKVSYPAKLKDNNYKDFVDQCKWLVRSVKADTYKKMSFYVDDRHGHDDIVISWFLSVWAERLLREEGFYIGQYILPQSMIYRKEELLEKYF